MKPIILLVSLVLCGATPLLADTCPASVSTGVTSCYYIANGGSDAAAGTKVAPWAHLRGMPSCTTGHCTSQTPAAGQGFIFKGGDTWHATDLGVAWSWSGTSSNTIYLGVDATWYTGSSWTRPIWTCDGSPCASNPGGPHTQIQVWAQYVTIDNLEFTGLYINSADSFSVNSIQLAGVGVEVKNSYCHGWTRNTGTGGNDIGCFEGYIGNGAAQIAGTSIHDNVIDGYDSYQAGTRTGVGIANAASVYNNVVRYVYNGINGAFDNVYNNLVEHVDYFASSGNHCNGMYHKTPLVSNTVKIYNNVIRDSSAEGCVMWYVMGDANCPSCNTYFYNNLMYNTQGDTQVTVAGDPGSVGGTLYYYNDTLQSTVPSCIGNGLSNVSGAAHYANIHCINSNGASTVCASGGGITCTDDAPGHSRSETLASANANRYCEPGVGGCTATYPFAPPTGSSPTVGAGTNESASIATFGSAFGYDTSLAVSYDAVNHRVVAPGRTAIVRPTNWDIGAYQYAPAFNTPNIAQSTQVSTAVTALKTASKGQVKVCTSTGGFSSGPPTYNGGYGSLGVVNLSHPKLGTNGGAGNDGVCDWTSLTTLSSCGNTIGANTIATPGEFGSQRVVVLTDSTTVAASTIWLTADDGFPSLWNSNDTALVLKIQGGARRIMKFNPTTMQGTLSSITVASDGSTWSTSTSHPDWLYQLGASNNVTVVKQVMDFNGDTSSTEVVKDLGADANCFGAAYTAQWTSVMLSPPNDQVFTVGASTGAQGTGFLAVSYDTSTGQCTVLNTQTGAVTKNGVSQGTIGWAERSTIHEVYQTPNPRYATVVLDGVTGPEIWDLQNPTLSKHCGDGYFCDGHNAWGVQGLIRGKNLLYHSYADPSVPQTVNLPNAPSYPNNHPSWDNVHATDAGSWFLNKTQDATPTVDPLGTLPVAFYDEIWMAKNDGSGTVSRQFHTFASGTSTEPLGVKNAIASISQTGKFVVWVTDGLGQFGNVSGAASCTLGTNCRTAILVGELK